MLNGCTKQVLAKHPIRKAAYDRGLPPPAKRDPTKVTMYDKYVAAVGSKRKSVTETTTIVLDKESTNPVRIGGSFKR